MEKENILIMKNELLKVKEKRAKLLKTFERIEELKENKDVIEYIKLENQDTEENRKLVLNSEEDLITQIIQKYSKEEEKTNGIYYCLGKNFHGYKSQKNIYILNIETNGSIPTAIYKDIENSSTKMINTEECDEFEKHHRVINNGINASITEYLKIQREFYNEIFSIGEEETVRRILKKYHCEK